MSRRSERERTTEVELELFGDVPRLEDGRNPSDAHGMLVNAPLRVPLLERLLDAPAPETPAGAARALRRDAPPPADEPAPTKAEKSGRIKSNRGVDSLFRNAYRSQLDMLALAAMKANIMISLNGLLMSMLIISGTHFIGVDAHYIVPISLLLVTCAIATVFAVLAARPDISRRNFTRADFETDHARLLVFEQFSDLEEGEYIDAMTNMLGDPQRLYGNMAAHIHELGTTADRKYRLLYYSYTTFMMGIVVTVATLLLLEGVRWWRLVPLA